MGIEIIAIILFILFTIEIVYIFMYSGDTNEVQQNISSGGINLPPLPPPPFSNSRGRINSSYVFDSDFDNGRMITSDIDYIERSRRGRNRGRNRDRDNRHQHLTNIEFLIGNNKNTATTIQSEPRFDFEDNDSDYKIDLKNKNKNKKLFIKFHIHKHSNRGNNRNRNNRHRNRHRNNRHHNRHRNRDDDDDSDDDDDNDDETFNIRYRITNKNKKNILDELPGDLSGKFKYDNNNQILKIGKIDDISKISDTIRIKINLE